ncbi:4-phosphoerythronate dehydrogenase PdxB [Draconibacterium sp. IB214405]|uniref:4-phosphoerythronate dehydrogenase PdxB n=1 Tax=Draconibacterium sp. IB214405 TaxID=3097352 RepID=UPI002A133A10|nr:4-phosphoerythronate dehydrogenase PdxB [Draconibacterium sp. IB214405]MDX8339454.1 4-phosphoerythronate dehydrogenase PdxB [Draconibacterium sp. IB214405]
MKVIIDNKIPYIKGALEPFAEVVYLPGSETTPEVVKDADAIITRTRTICNRKLLRGSKVKYIATATIGFDHIDTDYCKEAGIEWTNAPGCNAESVNQYIASALFSWSMRKRTDLAGLTIGIVGVGNVGKRVEKTCRILGMNVLLNDPPRERAEGSENFVALETIQKEADIITFHVPLNMTGDDATFHMLDEDFLQNLKKNPLIINSCRGEVCDSEAIYNAIEAGDIKGFIADCWENEPDINLDLLNLCEYGTPHIAGYSKDGKANGTKMSVQAISRFFGLGIDEWEPTNIEEPATTTIEIDGSQRREYSILAEAILSTYDIENDDDDLRDAPLKFEQLRGDYPVRREFATYTINAKNIEEDTLNKLKELGFKIQTK